MRPLPALPPSRDGVFTTSEAAAAGWTRSALRHAVRTGRCAQLRPGVLRVVTDATFGLDQRRNTLRAAAVAAAMANPDAVISHSCSTILLGLPVLDLPARPCLTVRPAHTGDIAGVHRHAASVSPRDVLVVDGIPYFGVERTVVDVGREHGLRSCVVTADAALHEGRTSAEALSRKVRELRGWPGVRASRRAVELADGRAESPLESLSRLAMWARVPAPELQVALFTSGGRFLGRVDFFWREFGVVGEADGLMKYDDGAALRAEKLRQEDLEDHGLVVVRWGYGQLSDIDAFIARLNRAFVRAASRRGPNGWTAAAPVERTP